VALTFDSECRAAVNVAKRCVHDGGALDVAPLLSAVYHETELHRLIPAFAQRIPKPVPLRPEPPETVNLAEPLKPILRKLIVTEHAVTARELFLALADSDAGRAFLRLHGVRDEELDGALPGLEVAPAQPAATVRGWRESDPRREAVEALSSYGRLLTDKELPDRRVVEREAPLRSLIEILCRMGRRNAIIVGHAGTGKTALVYELARRMVEGHASIPAHLKDADIFELSPVFLRSGASMVGQYEERVKTLLQVLRSCRNIILFVDEVHSLFQSGVHERGPYSDANEAFKAALGHNEITCIGCTSLAEYRRFIEPDRALVRRFALVHVDPPSREATINILRARLGRMREHYAPLVIPEAILPRVVDLTDENVPALHQPDKSIQLLDAACAGCTIAQPPAVEVTEDFLKAALGDLAGQNVLAPSSLTPEAVYGRLKSEIFGQDEVIGGIARAFVSGLGDFLPRGKGPRGVFLFGGPTGVGKTKTALIMAELLGGGREGLIRVDCNTLQGSGFDSGPAINRLIGVPPGYIGYARGQGGILSRVRDHPQCVVLFDEFEKADPGVGELLLRILDDGRTEDVDGNVLDFRKSFIVFTSNAGCVYDARGVLGFDPHQRRTPTGPRVEADALWADLRRLGLGQEFQGRIPHQFFFRALDAEAIRAVLMHHLQYLARRLAARGVEMTWEEPVIPHLASHWQQHLGARNAAAVVRTSVEEPLKVASASAELDGVHRVHLALRTGEGARSGEGTSIAETTWRRAGETLEILLA
jgi:ATP-dependent Clp protease ATP-binding subunit ClpA